MPKAYTLCLNWDIKVVQHIQTNKCDTLAKHNVEIVSSTVPQKMFKTNIISTKKTINKFGKEESVSTQEMSQVINHQLN